MKIVEQEGVGRDEEVTAWTWKADRFALSLNISNSDQNKPFSLTQNGPSLNGVSSWSLGVSGLNYDTGPKTYYLDLAQSDSPDRFNESQVSSSRIIITVEDVPDQFPVWVEPCYPKTIFENISISITQN